MMRSTSTSTTNRPEEPNGPERELRARQNPILIAHVARTPESDNVSDAEAQAPDQGKEGGRYGDRTHELGRVKAAAARAHRAT